MIRTGWVRVKTDHPAESSIQIMTLGEGGQWGMYQPVGNGFIWRFDDQDPDIDTVICVIGRWQDNDEIHIETVWHENDQPQILMTFEVYYTELKMISARECIIGHP